MLVANQTIVVLPAYNEEAALSLLLDSYLGLIRDHAELNLRIVVVNDGSTDRTLEILESYRDKLPLEIVNHEKNKGLGEAIRTCLKEAMKRSASDGDILVCMDADNTHLPQYIPALVEKIKGGADIAIASRFQPGSKEVGVPFIRRIYSRGARFLFTLFLRLPDVRDYTCGYRAYRAGLIRKALEEYGDRIISRNGFACTDDLLVHLAIFTDRISEIPFVLRYDNKIGKSKLPLLVTIVETLRLLFHSQRKLCPDNPRILIPYAWALAQDRKWEEAEKQLLHARNASPENPSILLFLGILYYDLKRFPEAFTCFETCLEKQPANQLARNFSALALFAVGQKEEAIQSLKNEHLEHNIPFLCRLCALLESELHQSPCMLEERQSDLFSGQDQTIASPVSPEDRAPPGYFARKSKMRSAIKALNNKDYDTAGRLFLSLRSHNPMNATAIFGLVISLTEKGAYGKARDILLDYLDRKEGSLEPHLVAWLGRLYILLGGYERGIALLKSICVEGPVDYNINYYLGLAYLFLKKTELAFHHFDRAFRFYYVDTLEDCLLPLVHKVGDHIASS